MSTASFKVAAAAQLQVARLSPREKQKLGALLAGPDSTEGAVTRRTPAGRFISRLGPSKRVLWSKAKDGVPRVLSIVDQSYASES